MKLFRMLMAAVLCAGMVTCPSLAGEEGEKEGRKGGWDEFREANKDEWDAFQKEQEAANDEFKKSLDGLTGNARIDAVIAHRGEMFAKRLEFKKSMHEKRVADMTEKLTAEGVTGDKLAERLAAISERYTEHVKSATERHEEAMTKLEAIKADTSLTDEQKDAEVKRLWEEAKAQRQERRESREKESGEHEKSE